MHMTPRLTPTPRRQTVHDIVILHLRNPISDSNSNHYRSRLPWETLVIRPRVLILELSKLLMRRDRSARCRGCLYSQLCSNGDELFVLGVGERWTCQFSERAFRELQQLLLTPPLQPTDATGCTTKGRCMDWCDRFSCDRSQYAACGFDRGCRRQNPG